MNDARDLNVSSIGANLMLYKREVKEAELRVNSDILVTHRYVSAKRSSSSNDEGKSAKSQIDEFLVNQAYTCEVIITNVSPEEHSCSILYQIPKGSLPLQKSQQLKSDLRTIQPYSTEKLTFHFYFPNPGNFLHFPTNVAINGTVVARASNLPPALKVVSKLSVVKAVTFLDILKNGQAVWQDQVIAFMQTHNITT